MRLIHTSGFSIAERAQYRQLVFANMLTSMRTMLEAMEVLEIPLEVDDNDAHIDLLIEERELGVHERMPQEYYAPFRDMWADAGVQVAARRGNEYALHDNVHYFFNQLDRLFEREYLPSDQDILHCRLKTTGISETIFKLKDLTYRMFDVGGQRSERKKWIHCFENVTALLFMVAISGYDQCLVEDKDANQISEALMLFDSISNSQWFVQTSIILFLNKVDLFRYKLTYSPIREHFGDFDADQSDEEACLRFFQQKFIKCNRSQTKDIYTHFTTATDTNLLRSVMTSVTDIILQKNLKQLIL